MLIQKTIVLVAVYMLGIAFGANLVYGFENACAVRLEMKEAAESIGPLELLSGGSLFVCSDGTIEAPAAQISQHEWWRLGTIEKDWRNPLVTVCLVPQDFSYRDNQVWHNTIGILAPYVDDELNYATSFRRDGNVIIKKEVTDYRNLSGYQEIIRAMPFNVRVGMVASIRGTGTHKVIQTWVNIGGCNVDTSKPPAVVGYDEANPIIQEGALVLRTDFLSHHVLEWKACETTSSGRACAGPEVTYIPLW